MNALLCSLLCAKWAVGHLWVQHSYCCQCPMLQSSLCQMGRKAFMRTTLESWAGQNEHSRPYVSFLTILYWGN